MTLATIPDRFPARTEARKRLVESLRSMGGRELTTAEVLRAIKSAGLAPWKTLDWLAGQHLTFKGTSRADAKWIVK